VSDCWELKLGDLKNSQFEVNLTVFAPSCLSPTQKRILDIFLNVKMGRQMAMGSLLKDESQPFLGYVL
jgi:hypothetical protein